MKTYATYEETKRILRDHCVRTREQYHLLRNQNKALKLPSNPYVIYKNDWVSWTEFFAGVSKFVTYKHAKTMVRDHDVRTKSDYRRFYKSYKISARLPSEPDKVYENEWVSWGDFTGFSYGKRIQEYVRPEDDRFEEYISYVPPGEQPIEIPFIVKALLAFVVLLTGYALLEIIIWICTL